MCILCAAPAVRGVFGARCRKHIRFRRLTTMGDAEFRNVVALTDGMVRVEDGFYVNEETGDSLEYVTKGTRIMDTVCAQDGWYKMRDGVVSGPLEV